MSVSRSLKHSFCLCITCLNSVHVSLMMFLCRFSISIWYLVVADLLILLKILQYSLSALAVSEHFFRSSFVLYIDDVNIPDVTNGSRLRYFLVTLIVLIGQYIS